MVRKNQQNSRRQGRQQVPSSSQPNCNAQGTIRIMKKELQGQEGRHNKVPSSPPGVGEEGTSVIGGLVLWGR